MQNSFTLHCIPWHAGDSLLQDIRVAACASGLLSAEEMGLDDRDMACRHALALSKGGRAIGCARLTPEGHIERIAVMPHEQREQVIAALIDTLKDYARHAGLARTTIAEKLGGIG